MPAQVTTRAQVNGYRFQLRRLQHALIRADSRMIHDPMRGQMRAMLTGLAIAILIAGAAGVLAFFKPSPNFGNSSIMLSEADGTLYVRIANRLHPALNLASARLIAGKNETPGRVDHKFLDTVPRGPLVGIVGARDSLRPAADLTTSSWTVCDNTLSPPANQAAGPSAVETTVLTGVPWLGRDTRPAIPGEALLVRSFGTTYLLYDGKRAVFDPTDPVLTSALRLGTATPREISPGLLNAFPLVAPITPIRIAGAGGASPYLPADSPIGSLVRTVDSQGEQLYVVLAQGLQPVSVQTADVIRYSDPQSPAAFAPGELSPARLSQIPIVHALPIDDYPTGTLELVADEASPVLCTSWQRGNAAGGAASTRVLLGTGLPLAPGAQPVRLASADAGGPGLDAVYVKPGTGEYVQSTGMASAGRAVGDLFYVSDLGVRYHVKDTGTAAALGMVGVRVPGETADRAQPAPWSMLSLLPPGPDLSQQAALIVHDGMAADPAGAPLPSQGGPGAAPNPSVGLVAGVQAQPAPSQPAESQP